MPNRTDVSNRPGPSPRNLPRGHGYTTKLRLKVNEGKSTVARPEERKFLGFSISNDGSERRIAPKALDKFKTQIRDITRRTRGVSLSQLIEELKPYLFGWRAYFGFCQTPRVLTNLEAWIRRRLRSYLWRQWRNGHTRFTELRRRGVPRTRGASLRSPASRGRKFVRLSPGGKRIRTVGPPSRSDRDRDRKSFQNRCCIRRPTMVRKAAGIHKCLDRLPHPRLAARPRWWPPDNSSAHYRRRGEMPAYELPRRAGAASISRSV